MATASPHLAINFNFLAFPAFNSSRELSEGQGPQRRKSHATNIDNILVWEEYDKIVWGNETVSSYIEGENVCKRATVIKLWLFN